MQTTAPTPSWLTGLLVIFSLAAAVVFGLYLYRHTEKASLSEQHSLLSAEVVPLRLEAAAAEGRIAPLDGQIVSRRQLLQPIETFDSTNRADVDRALTTNSATIKANDGLQERMLRSFNDVMREAPERRNELGREEERAFATQRDNETRRDGLRDEVESKKATLEGQKKKFRGEKVVADARIDELNARIAQLTSQLAASNAEFRPDGSILQSEAANGFVVIDRGYVHQLRKGTKFTVFNRRGGKVVPKGQVQVDAVQERIATCRVLTESDANDPIVAGDLLHNPVYDADRVRSFAVRGKFSSFSRTEIERFIREAGGIVEPQLTVNVDFLVAGADCRSDLDLAAKLGMSVLGEDQLVDYLKVGSRPSPETWAYVLGQAKAGKRFGLAGRFERANEDAIRSAIEANGGKTSSGVSEGDAGLIVGSGAESEIAEARSLNVPVLDERHFTRLADPEALDEARQADAERAEAAAEAKADAAKSAK